MTQLLPPKASTPISVLSLTACMAMAQVRNFWLLLCYTHYLYFLLGNIFYYSVPEIRTLDVALLDDYKHHSWIILGL